jgi:serine/threonine-protein kinase HipA
MSPMHDVPCTLIYGDDTTALPIAGTLKNLRARHWAEFAEALGLPLRAAASAIELAALPFDGSQLRGAERELRFRRH